jgi:hypothetical protein
MIVTTGGRDTSSSAVSSTASSPKSGEVLLLAHGLEAELARDQLDLIEVEALVDGDHQPQVLEREARRSASARPSGSARGRRR